MNLLTLLDMVAGGNGDITLLGTLDDGLTGAQLQQRSLAGGGIVRESGADTVIFLGGNGPAFPVALFASAYAGVPFLPINFRLSGDQIDEIISRSAHPLIVTDDPERAGAPNAITTADFLARTSAAPPLADPADPDVEDIAVLLMTSGTTAAPKSAVLRHRHLTSYVLGSVEFASAEATDATIVSVPPYHIAAVANLLSNLFAGRRIVYLDQFTPRQWLDTVRGEKITNAMVVPTMLVRIVRELVAAGETGPPTLKGLSYGGAKISAPALAHALELFPHTGFVNAYGLTETASSIAVLGPDDHRDALASDDPGVRAHLASVGRALPSVEIEVHDFDGSPCAPGVVGDIVVRGPQVAGEYLEAGSLVDADGWFPTRDLGYLDADGFLFVQGRADDTIIRGGENIAPAEIEAVLSEHESVADCAVAGIPDAEWGHRIAAFVVTADGHTADADALRAWVRAQLRSSKTPDDVIFLDELPTTPTGKILRRNLVASVRSDVPA
ncbi:class I adenylate-forming enzyme family protein [Rhodococcus cercidiphylli]|uniref:Fatty acid--CoA ligase family protein n=1 Tax=Rhodococcus cercidiphylli TaxID=489916 RepID=A0ABU4AWF4_9NOCA|nr:fatty acid--CoA ligase family protein [Rhodococcus cercidiphylli]MDV6230565.1 fatty acid--CoA ligase family protein [Rhodococcus cercidiphylli]